ncbi:2,3-diaminopropionate biosynthesis protein SbnA [Nonomuraea sp. NPDC052265]|uniref:2,3-diaminopropionate biosynthesis protein SbnA n=1 Tax=Nonomuraea sp. NPDC052265 TaxID=3364374 RepID=UPI0037C8640A
MIYERIHDIVMDDIFLRVTDVVPDVDIYLKLEGLNPTGSIKIKPAISMIRDAETRGLLRPGSRVVESSSGSLGIALAMVCAARSYRFLCVTDPNISAQSLAIMKALGADVVQIDRRDANGGYLGSRIAYINELMAADPGIVWLNQYANSANWIAHAETTAAAIHAELSELDYLFVGAGTAGTLMGCVRYFRHASPGTKVVAVDAVGSVSFGGPAGARHIPGIGTSSRPEILRPDEVEDLVLVDECEAVRVCRWLARERGIFVGGSTGSIVAAIIQRAPDLPPGSRVVGIAPDLGDRYAQTVYDDTWVDERLMTSDDALPTIDLDPVRG